MIKKYSNLYSTLSRLRDSSVLFLLYLSHQLCPSLTVTIKVTFVWKANLPV